VVLMTVVFVSHWDGVDRLSTAMTLTRLVREGCVAGMTTSGARWLPLWRLITMHVQNDPTKDDRRRGTTPVCNRKRH